MKKQKKAKTSKKTKSNKPFGFVDDMYGQTYIFLMGTPAKQVYKLLDKAIDCHNFDEELSSYGGMTWIGEKGAIMIWSRYPARNINAIPVLAHECVHAANITLDLVGVKTEADNDEPLAYMVTLLLNKALKLR